MPSVARADDDTSDVLIVGAGPAALFCVFQLGLYGLSCRLVDSLDRPGGQCAVLYPDKPIFDVPGFPEIDGAELTARLMRQIEPFAPRFVFGETIMSVEAEENSGFSACAASGRMFRARAVVLATGLGTFRRQSDLSPEATLTAGPAREWAFARRRDAFEVEPERFETSSPGIFAIGDACDYPGKLRLILSAFHEAALTTQAVRRLFQPEGRTVQQYTTTSSTLQSRLGVSK